MNTSSKTSSVVMTALMIAIITVSIMFIKFPVMNGYVHLGDAMIFIAVLVLGWKNGAIAAGVGAALGDVLGGFAMWAPWSFVIKGVMAIILGLMIEYALKKKWIVVGKMPLGAIVGMIVSGIVMVLGYFVAEGIMYSWPVAVIAVPWNIGQFVVGLIIAWIITAALLKTPARKFFAYRFEIEK